MKLKNALVARKGDNVKYTGMWFDKMRRPCKVTIKIEKNVPVDENEVFLEGDAYDTHHVLEHLAEIAWDNGWRPTGLINTVASVIQTFKIVK